VTYRLFKRKLKPRGTVLLLREVAGMGEKLLIGLLRFSFANGEREFHGGREGSILMFRRIKEPSPH